MRILLDMGSDMEEYSELDNSVCLVIVVASNSSSRRQSLIYSSDVFSLGARVSLHVDSSNCLAFNTAFEGSKVLSAFDGSSHKL